MIVLAWLLDALLHLGVTVLVSAGWAVLATGLRKVTYRFPRLYRFATRNQLAALAMLKSLDIVACTLWLAPLYIVGLADKPTGRRMISSYIGMAAFNGHRWAMIAETVIDWGAMRFGDRPHHCMRAWAHYKGLDL